MNEQQFSMKSWIYHTEWLALMATVISCFLFVHKESVHNNQRLDNHIESINRRCDELYKAFYELLRETKK